MDSKVLSKQIGNTDLKRGFMVTSKADPNFILLVTHWPTSEEKFSGVVIHDKNNSSNIGMSGVLYWNKDAFERFYGEVALKDTLT